MSGDILHLDVRRDLGHKGFRVDRSGLETGLDQADQILGHDAGSERFQTSLLQYVRKPCQIG